MGEWAHNTILKWCAIAGSWLVGLIFIYAGLTKIVALPEVSFSSGAQIKMPEGGVRLIPTQDFAKAIGNYRLLPNWMNRAMAATLPWVEIAAGFALFTRRFRYEAALAICAMLLMFIVALAHAIRHKLDIACGCFSVSASAQKLGVNTLLLDLALLAIVGIVLWHCETRRREMKHKQSAPIQNLKSKI
jgi:uncharacterized membrane protein